MVASIQNRNSKEQENNRVLVGWQTQMLATFIAATLETEGENPLLEAAQNIPLDPMNANNEGTNAGQDGEIVRANASGSDNTEHIVYAQIAQNASSFESPTDAEIVPAPKLVDGVDLNDAAIQRALNSGLANNRPGSFEKFGAIGTGK